MRLPERVPYGSAYGIESIAAQEALCSAAVCAIDEAADSCSEFRDEPEAISTIARRLPEVYEDHYASVVFLKKWLVTSSLVGWKFAQPEPSPLTNVAEEIACHLMIEEAISILETEGSGTAEAFEQLRGLYEDAFEDNDYLGLYEIDHPNELAGLDPHGHLGMTDLQFESWFRPFGSGADQGVPHPYLTPS